MSAALLFFPLPTSSHKEEEVTSSALAVIGRFANDKADTRLGKQKEDTAGSDRRMTYYYVEEQT